jgi:heat shock protein HslJ
MKKNMLYNLLLLTVVLNFACGESANKESVVYKKISTDTTVTDSSATGMVAKDTLPTVTDQHNSANSLDWDGTYKGTLPCADCGGIETVISLSKEMTYTIKTKYIGKGDESVKGNGSFTWNAAGNTIILTGLKNTANQYFVGENKLIQLDMTGNKITGALADKYALIKQKAGAAADSSKPGVTLVETYWKLTELMGKPLEKSADGRREVHLILKQKDNRVQGFAGCNTIMGAYEVKDGNLLKFSKLASTLMACDDMRTEDAFKKVLEQTDNYSIRGENLSLHKAKMAPLAKFKAVYFK